MNRFQLSFQRYFIVSSESALMALYIVAIKIFIPIWLSILETFLKILWPWKNMPIIDCKVLHFWFVINIRMARTISWRYEYSKSLYLLCTLNCILMTLCTTSCFCLIVPFLAYLSFIYSSFRLLPSKFSSSSPSTHAMNLSSTSLLSLSSSLASFWPIREFACVKVIRRHYKVGTNICAFIAIVFSLKFII